MGGAGWSVGHLVEDFSSPCTLCGVCLRKLQFRLGFGVLGRYQRLRDVYHAAGMQAEVRWLDARVAYLERICPGGEGA